MYVCERSVFCIRLFLQTYDRVVALHGQSVVLHGTGANHVQLPVTRRGSEVGHISEGRAGHTPGVSVRVVMFNFHIVQCCAYGEREGGERYW